ncbi:unnamed protein product [Chrysodeixis includens]|uniref:Uncharacterized protein n=1 Tax=Chrysodeixis includens TaxID=689277 RepID=A0A9N8KY03_CHRIL|nr:unnamed protein product [Chrysodeixis includens]
MFWHYTCGSGPGAPKAEKSACTITIFILSATFEPPNNTPAKTPTLKTTTLTSMVNEASSSIPTTTVADLRPLFLYPPTTSQRQSWGQNNARYRMLLRSPQSLTKLAKTLSIGFDPSFSKDYFEPFERRTKPVTLIAFRKNGFAPRRTIKYAERESTEIAEQQSPYNEVGSFWQDDLIET